MLILVSIFINLKNKLDFLAAVINSINRRNLFIVIFNSIDTFLLILKIRKYFEASVKI